MGQPAGRGVVIDITWLGVAAIVLVAVVATVAAAALVLASQEPPHEGGDPGGRMFAQLVPVSHAVPAAVHVISRNYRDASWEECVGAPGSGWVPTMVSVHFSTSMPPEQVVNRVGQELARGAWQLDHVDTLAAPAGRGGPSTYTEAIWRKRLADGTSATAVLHSSDERNDWWLYASAPPLGAEFPDVC